MLLDLFKIKLLNFAARKLSNRKCIYIPSRKNDNSYRQIITKRRNIDLNIEMNFMPAADPFFFMYGLMDGVGD